MTNKKVVTGTGDNFGFEETTINPFALVYAEYEKNQNEENLTIETGNVYTGTLLSKLDRYYVLDINSKSPVYVLKDSLEKTVLEDLELGSQIDVKITSIIDKKDFSIYGSTHQVLIGSVYDFLEKSAENNTILTGIPIDMNHAGYTVSVIINDQNISLFMPHLLTDVNKLPNQESILNTEIDFMLDIVNRDGQKQYIANRKAYLNTLVKKAMKDLEKGGQYQGYVINVTDYAVFVQFNECLTCMIHKSNLSEVSRELFDAGKIQNNMGIEFFIKDIIKGKIFSTQRQELSLWDTIEVNDILTGKAVAIKDFGVLVELDYETKGLLHRSVLKSDLNQYKKGQSIKVKVTNVNKSNRQITLNLV